ncbi:MAG: hypothetical protein KatS3mg058_1203 [Roseiflexus sp.]|nr:MAG: hypothetical protein KatS3mg058_1203 [Roseiflexus sp.]
MNINGIRCDICVAKRLLLGIPVDWDGKESVLKLKDVNYNWRQMEWWSFYFEYLCRDRLKSDFTIPGDSFGKVKTACFDLKRTINWDLKVKAIKSDDHRSILNDKRAIDNSIGKYDAHGFIVALCDVEYDDDNRTFQKWHEELKGGKSKYEKEREQRTIVSRYRKTRAVLQEILFLLVTPENRHNLLEYRQGRNSNGKPRPTKYMLDFDQVNHFLVCRMLFLPHISDDCDCPLII